MEELREDRYCSNIDGVPPETLCHPEMNEQDDRQSYSTYPVDDIRERVEGMLIMGVDEGCTMNGDIVLVFGNKLFARL